jgi:hypothetical protein
MGDSDITLYLSVLASLLVAGAVIAFAIACRIRCRAVRVTVGLVLLAIAAVCGILSVLAALLVAALGVAALALAGKTPRIPTLETQGKNVHSPRARSGGAAGGRTGEVRE